MPSAGRCGGRGCGWLPGRARLARVRVYVGSDHAGFELKSVLVNWLTSAGHEVTDYGPASYHEHDDYPPCVMHAAAAAAAACMTQGG